MTILLFVKLLPEHADQQQQEQEQQVVGQEVVPPGVSTILDEAKQVEPKFF